MDNDLYTATETLRSAYQEAIENDTLKIMGTRWQFKRFKEAITQRNLTISERLLLCYEPKKELFPSKKGKETSDEIYQEKALRTHNESLKLRDEFWKLTK